MDLYQKALELDHEDPIKSYRDCFYIPCKDDNPLIYFCGHSLGLQPKNARIHINKELDQWAMEGVKGHFNEKNPWYYYHRFLMPELAAVTGSKEQEVCPMNSLTVNLHLALISFYRPQKNKYKILVEKHIFPSDKLALESQVKMHGYNPDETIIYADFDNNDNNPEDKILQLISLYRDELALIFIGAINFYTGSFFNIGRITEAAHNNNLIAGFDLAHAIGNIPLSLHDWKVDFAVWCSYKYLNAGPGSVGGFFVHEEHGNTDDIHRLAGWWGQKEKKRFDMYETFDALPGVEGWQLSNAPVLSMAALRASLSLFEEVGIDVLRKKARKMQFFINELFENFYNNNEHLYFLSPYDIDKRGNQVSFKCNKSGKDLYSFLESNGIITDWREPDVLRIAPVPFYNTFEEIWYFFYKTEKYINNYN